MKKIVITIIACISIICILFTSYILVSNNEVKLSGYVSISNDNYLYSYNISSYKNSTYNDSISIEIYNGLKNDIYFDASFIQPFCTLYFEIFENEEWKIYYSLLGEAEAKLNWNNYSLQDWMDTSTKLPAGEKTQLSNNISNYQLRLFEGKYRLKLCYINMSKNTGTDYSNISYFYDQVDNYYDVAYSDAFWVYDNNAENIAPIADAGENITQWINMMPSPDGPRNTDVTKVKNVNKELNASKSYDIDGEIINWTWIISSEYCKDTILFGEVVTYKECAPATVTLIVTDNKGKQSNDMIDIIIEICE